MNRTMQDMYLANEQSICRAVQLFAAVIRYEEYPYLSVKSGCFGKLLFDYKKLQLYVMAQNEGVVSNSVNTDIDDTPDLDPAVGGNLFNRASTTERNSTG
ncbi:unnamed protein product [Hermetia illucens]|uniref:Uncharacterized protein n=1 Tax=Hermetia illucens TaxID=343691 RepID=A0A7R8UD65_HERIL|nr:unnamed protein product [Hermetia illucens]